ncbi:MAG: D-alanine--D-alanine ligase [Myxococcaceae bacterium]|nr:D-alanine--D-alanine ligase [Myxococcaceae bacterium]
MLSTSGGLPSRTAILVNTDFESRTAELGSAAPRGFEADAAVLDTSRAVLAAIEQLGVEVVELRFSSSLKGLVEQLKRRDIGTVFNLIESIDNDYGREWQVPALLDKHRIRYTGNGSVPLRLCRAKDSARTVLRRAGVRVARGLVVKGAGELSLARLRALPFPCFVKPARVDGSIGIDRDSVCVDAAALRARVEQLERHLPGPYLVEEYLPGKEINVALFPDPVHGYVVPTEIDFSVLAPELPRFVTYDSKWNPESPEYVTKSVPAELDASLRAEVERVARSAFVALGGSSYGRVDMRLDVAGQPCVIDVNPNNDLHPEAGLAVAARSVGLGYEALIGCILARAHETQP